MPTRVVMGTRANGQKGLFVSKAGHDADYAAAENLLLSTDFQALQIVATGVITNPGVGSTVSVSFPVQPVVPFLWIVGGRNNGLVRTLTTAGFSVQIVDGGTNWPGGTPTSNFYWTVLNAPFTAN